MIVERTPINDFDAEHNDRSVHIPDVIIQHELPDGSVLTFSPCFPPIGPMWLAEFILTPDAGDGYADVVGARQLVAKGKL